jgi:hypothetical protein
MSPTRASTPASTSGSADSPRPRARAGAHRRPRRILVAAGWLIAAASGILPARVAAGVTGPDAASPPVGEQSQGRDPAVAVAAWPRGIFVIAGRLDEEALNRVLALEGVAGLSLAATWEQLEPHEGEIDVRGVLALLAAAERRHKQAMLRVLPGVSTPEWVYAKGARRFTFVDRNRHHDDTNYPPGHRLHDSFGKTLSIPVPWDPAFLVAWERTVAALGRSLGAERSLVLVHMTGPNKHSAEMILPRSPEDRTRWQDLGYTKARLAEAWGRSIEAFAVAFPRQALALDLSPAVYRDGVVADVAAKAFTRLGPRLCLQNNILDGSARERGREDWAILADYTGKVPIAFQRQPQRLSGRDDLTPAERLELRRQGFAATLAAARERSAQYLEVGADQAGEFPDLVRDAARRMAATAPEAPGRNRRPGSR